MKTMMALGVPGEIDPLGGYDPIQRLERLCRTGYKLLAQLIF